MGGQNESEGTGNDRPGGNSGLREKGRIAPDAGESVRCQVDKIAKIAFPAEVVIAEEKQPPVAVNEDPSREVNSRDVAQLALNENSASE